MSKLWPTIRDQASTFSLCAAVMAIPFSIAWCHGCLIAFLILWLSENNWRQKINVLKNNRALQILIALGLMLLIGITYSDNKEAAWFTLEKKIFFFILPIAIANSAINTPRLSKLMLRVFCVCCGLALLICYAYAFNQWLSFEEGKIGSENINYLSSSALWNSATPKLWLFFSYVSLSGAIGMHPTYLSLYCAFCCVAMISEHRNSQLLVHKISTLAATFLFATSIIFLSSRIIIVLFVFVCIALLIYEIAYSNSNVRNILVIPVIVLCLVVGVTLNPVTKYRQVDEIISTGLSIAPGTNYTNSTAIRASLWWLSAKAYLESNLLIGTGPGDVHDAVRKMGERYKIANVLDSYDPHSQYLHLLLSSGAIGLLLFICYLATGFICAWQNRDLIFLSFLILFSTVCITETALELQKGIVFFSIFFPVMAFRSTGSVVAPSPKLANASV